MPFYFYCILIDNESVGFPESATNLGVFISNEQSMNWHVTHTGKVVCLEIRRFRHIICLHFVDDASLKTVVSLFILSRLYYCNYFLKI